MNTDEKRLLRDQILRLIVATPPCPDGAGGVACPRCLSVDVADAMETRIDAERLAK